ncbi:MAG: rRNA maturation RNase YbeY [Acidimicrobiia bacterium]
MFSADEQSDVEVDVAAYTELARAVLHDESVRGSCELAVFFVDEAAIAELNQRFLDGDGPTDVLAFPIDDEVAAGGRTPDAGGPGPDRSPPDPSEVPLLLGDVLVCPAVAARNAAEQGRTVADEIALLVVHGTLHVLGMDHAEDDEAARMQARERELLGRHWAGSPA